MIRYLFAAAALVAFIGAIWNPPASAQLPVGTCVIEYVSTPTNTGTKSVLSCENRAKFQAPTPPPPFTGQPCASPAANEFIWRVRLPDNSCLPIEAVAGPGFVVDNYRWWSNTDPNGNVMNGTVWAKLYPAPK